MRGLSFWNMNSVHSDMALLHGHKVELLLCKSRMCRPIHERHVMYTYGKCSSVFIHTTLPRRMLSVMVLPCMSMCEYTDTTHSCSISDWILTLHDNVFGIDRLVARLFNAAKVTVQFAQITFRSGFFMFQLSDTEFALIPESLERPVKPGYCPFRDTRGVTFDFWLGPACRSQLDPAPSGEGRLVDWRSSCAEALNGSV